MTGVYAINWREPLWLLLALQPLIIYLCLLLIRRYKHQQFADDELLPWVTLTDTRKKQGYWLKFFNLAAWISFAICMAGPRTADRIINTDDSSYTNLVISLDVSRSMTARDIHPSRLERAKLEILDLIDRSQRNRIAIILYADNAHTLVPYTSDKNLLRYYVSIISSSILPSHGSNIANSLAYSATLNADNYEPQAILLISDGEGRLDSISQYESTLTTIRDKNIPVFTLNVGTETGSALLDEHSGWLKDNEKDVITKSRPDLLEKIALRTNGKYAQVSDSDTEWKELYDNGISLISVTKRNDKSNSDIIIWNEHYPFFLIMGIIFFLLANLRYRHIKASSIFIVLTTSVVLLTIASSKTFANELYQEAYQAYQNKDYMKAEKEFSRINNFNALIGYASSAYQNKNYHKAATLFIQASIKAQTDQQRVHTLFNLGNTFYMLEHYQQAANIYNDVLKYQPNHKNAKTNLASALALIKQENKNTEKKFTQRGSKGPNAALLEPEGIPAKGNLTLGKEDDTIPFEITGQNTDNLKQETDLNSAGIVSESVETEKDVLWTYQIQSIDQIANETANILDKENEFWQRLFEWEEGYPAPLQQPVSVPGVNPW